MKISDYLKEEMICLDLKATGEEESIRELGEYISKSKDITNCDAFLKDVLEREKFSTTGIGDEVAIPHARSSNVSQFVIAFGRSDKGIEFNSLDNKKAKLIFLMGTVKTDIDQYLMLLAHLTRLLKKESFRKLLLAATKPEEVIEIFKKAEI